MSSVEEVKKELERTTKDLNFYKEKVRDVVRAYKSLESEKKALETIVKAIDISERGDDAKENGELEASVRSMKAALVELTREKDKREQAYVSDKKALVDEVDRQKAKIEKMSDQLRAAQSQISQAEKIIDRVKEQKLRIIQIEADRNRELQDHGCVLAEMQKRYAEERMKAEKLSKQLAEMYTKQHERDGIPAEMKAKEAEYKAQTQRLEAEIEEWKKRAAIVPSVQLLQDKIVNIKSEHEHALKEVLRTASQQGLSAAEEQRRHDLEERVMLMSKQVADADRRRAEADERLSAKESECQELLKLIDRSPSRVESESSIDIPTQIRKLIMELKNKDPDVDIFAIIDARESLDIERKKFDLLQEEFENYKLEVEAVLKSKTSEAAEKASSSYDDGMRTLISQLHDKMRVIEVAHATDRAQYETTLRAMKERIGELEQSKEKSRTEVRREMASKVAEMEMEMQKQRERTLDLLAEKERELEATRSILVSVRGEQLGSAPADPPHKHQLAKRKSSEVRKYGDSRRSGDSRHRSMDSVSSMIECHADSTAHLPLTNESRNIYYEEEMVKKDVEIKELRNSLHQLDYRMREVDQGYLCRDLQQHEQAEKLKEEIRILEGKLRLVSSGGDSEYLRNIFVQLLSCENASAKRNILKAMGMCLKLSPNEMKNIDKKFV